MSTFHPLAYSNWTSRIGRRQFLGAAAAAAALLPARPLWADVPNAKIPDSLAAVGSSGKPVKMSAEAGKVIVSVPDEPLAGCFFFTH